MNHDFDKAVQRRGTMSVKWSIADGELPMWIADMDFEAPGFIKDAVMATAEHGVYGYSVTPREYFDAISGFYERRHGYRFNREEMLYSSGVVAAISSVIRHMTRPNDKVLVQSPVYNSFYNCITKNERAVISSDLVYKNGEYAIDFSDLEKKLSDPATTLMILCNPHNPVGRIWSQEELAIIGELAKKNGVTVISDEIHCDMLRPGKHYVPFASVSDICREISVSCLSSSKTFNMAGLQSACLVIPNTDIRIAVGKGLCADDLSSPNIFSMSANIAAFTHGDEYVDQLVEYIFENRRIFEEFINKELPLMRPVYADATYLAWLDVSAYTDDSSAFAAHLRATTGLYVCAGSMYGNGGEGFLRINLATTRKNVLDALERLKAAADSFGK